MTDTKRYQSIYSDKKILSQQYIAELVCKNRAESLSMELPEKFWNIPQWKSYYLYQMKLANKLLAEFNADDIISCLKQYNNTFSLNTPFMRKNIQTIKEKRSQPKSDTKIYNRKTNPTIRKNIESSNLSEFF